MEIMGCLKLMRAVFGSECIEDVVKVWLSGLKLQERGVIELRFGLKDNSNARTLEEVGKEFSVSRERIRQIESKALRHIRLTIGLHKWFFGIFTK